MHALVVGSAGFASTFEINLKHGDTLEDDLNGKRIWDRLRRWFRRTESVAVPVEGGVDDGILSSSVWRVKSIIRCGIGAFFIFNASSALDPVGTKRLPGNNL